MGSPVGCVVIITPYTVEGPQSRDRAYNSIRTITSGYKRLQEWCVYTLGGK